MNSPQTKSHLSNRDALALIKTLYPHAFRFCSNNAEEAKDLVQDTMVKVICNYSKFQPGSNLNAWAFTIMKHTSITNHNRKMRRRQINDYSDSNYLIDSNAGPRDTSTIDIKFLMGSIDNVLMRCKRSHTMPYSLYIKGFKYSEISEQLSLPVGTVKNRIHVVRNKLRTALPSYRYN